MTTIATVTSVRTDGMPDPHWNSDATFGGANAVHVETRDGTVFWLDTDNHINFANTARTTIYRYNPTNFTTYATNTGVTRVGLLKDMQDNLLICFLGYGVYPHMRVAYWKYLKPAEGWAAWANNTSRGNLTSYEWSFNWYYAQQDSAYTGTENFAGWHVARAANISSGVLYMACAQTGNPNWGYNNTQDQVGFTMNLNTGGIITNGGYDSGQGAYYPYRPNNDYYVEGNTTYGKICTLQPFKPNSSEGARITWYNQNNSNLANQQTDAYNNRNNSYYYQVYSRWIIDANGNLTREGWSGTGGSNFGTLRTVDFEAGSGNVSVHTRSTTFAPTSYNSGYNGDLWWGDTTGAKQIIICTIFNGKPVLNTPRGYWYAPNSEWRPQNWTYASTPTNWVFTARNAPTITWISPTVLRMIASNGTNGAYMDITWDGTNFTFPATATAIPGLNTTDKIVAAGATLLDKYTALTKSNQAEMLTTPVNPTAYSYPTTAGSLPEPYVPVLKTNNGMKFQYISQSVANNANIGLFDTDNNYLPGPWTSFQFIRTSSGAGTEYYNYTTGAWTSSVVNNAPALFPSGGGACPPYSSTSQYTNDIQGTWADNTTYTYSFLFTDPNGVTRTSNSRTIATPAVSAAPTAPTPRRIFVYTLQNRTSSHVLSIENRILINKVNLVNQSGNSVGVTLNLGGYNFLSTVTLAPYQTAQFETAVIANVAERLLVTCTADASVDMWIMGTEGV